MGVPIPAGQRRAQRTAMRRVIKQMPGSVRALAEHSGVDHSTLLRVRSGTYTLSPAANKKLCKALRDWGATCYRLADELEAVGGAP